MQVCPEEIIHMWAEWNNMKELVIFDVDNTIVQGQTQQLFLNYLLKKKYISVAYYIRILAWFVLYSFGLVSNPLSVMRYAFSFARDKKISELSEMVDDFFVTVLRSKIYPESLAIIQKHQKQGHEVILVSNAVDILVQKISAYVRATAYLSTKLEVVDGVCTGNIIGDIMYGKEKLNAVEKYAQSNGMTLTHSWAYADHGSDISLLSHTTHPYAVNPTKKLKGFAVLHNWPILNFTL